VSVKKRVFCSRYSCNSLICLIAAPAVIMILLVLVLRILRTNNLIHFLHQCSSNFHFQNIIGMNELLYKRTFVSCRLNPSRAKSRKYINKTYVYTTLLTSYFHHYKILEILFSIIPTYFVHIKILQSKN